MPSSFIWMQTRTPTPGAIASNDSVGVGRGCPTPAQQSLTSDCRTPSLDWPRRNRHAAKATDRRLSPQRLSDERKEVESINRKAREASRSAHSVFICSQDSTWQTDLRGEKKTQPPKTCSICYLINFSLEINSSVPGEASGSGEFTLGGLTRCCCRWCV